MRQFTVEGYDALKNRAAKSITNVVAEWLIKFDLIIFYRKSSALHTNSPGQRAKFGCLRKTNSTVNSYVSL